MPETGYRLLALRYYPSLPTQEFVNVGVALVCPDLRWWNLRTARTLRHIKKVFPTAQPEAIRVVLNQLREAVSEYREQHPGGTDPLADLRSAAGQMVGALRWADLPIEGVTKNPEEDLEHWFKTLVSFEQAPDAIPTQVMAVRESAPTIVHLMEETLQQKGVWGRLKPAPVHSRLRHEFKHTFKNEKLHVFEAISFTGTEKTVFERAELWRGRIDALADDTRDRLSFVPLVELPTSSKAQQVAREALRIIERTKEADVVVFPTTDVDQYGEFVASIVRRHDSH